jgi:hypothetical protein
VIELTTGQGLAVAAAVPVIVIGWAVLFSVEAARRGPDWALRHLQRASVVTLLGLVLALAAAVIIRPLWIGLGAVYPLAVGWLLVSGRRRQLEIIQREMGFGVIEDEIRKRILSKLRTGLVVVGVLALGIGALLAGVGVDQGWIVAGLSPISLVAILRSNPPGLGASSPPSL